MAKRKFEKSLLREILWEDAPGKIEDTIVNHTRWSVAHKMIFKGEDGSYYEVFYSVGATEQQDESPFEYDPDEIECDEVEEREKIIKVWAVKE